MRTHPAATVTATPAARQAISALRARTGPIAIAKPVAWRGEPDEPICYPRVEERKGYRDLLVGEVDGCPVYLDRALYFAWEDRELVLDVAPGYPEGVSLAAGAGQHFVVRPGPDVRDRRLAS